jgi:hypothetical protein
VNPKTISFILLALILPVCAFAWSKGDVVDAKRTDGWYPAKIVSVDKKTNKYMVSFIGWSSSYNAWVTADSIRAYSFHASAPVSVLLKGKYYDAVILKEQGGKFFVHYKGFNNSYDEWVGPERIMKLR